MNSFEISFLPERIVVIRMTKISDFRRALLALLPLLLLLPTMAEAQRQLGGGVAIVLEDGTIGAPERITVAVPSSLFPGARADSLLFSWRWTLPTTVAPPATSTGVIVIPDDRYFMVADTSGASTWQQIYMNNNNFWIPMGNGGTTPGVGSNFVGTGDSTSFELYANNLRVARYSPVQFSPNITYGSDANSMLLGVAGGFIGGGGSAANPNRLNDARSDLGTIGGGEGNTMSGNSPSSAIPGGFGNVVSGSFSTAMGLGSSASGIYGAALGMRSVAGTYAFAAGRGSSASGTSATALGDSSTASGSSSVAMGRKAVASNSYSIAMNRGTSSTGSVSLAFGDSTTAAGNRGMAGGYAVSATGGSNRMILGNGLQSSSRLTNGTDNSLFVGFNDVGTAAGNNAAFAVVSNKVGVGMTSPGSRLTVRASTNNGTSLPVGTNQYALDLQDATNTSPGSHFFVLHTPNVGHYNPGTTPVNGAIIGIGDPLNPTLNTGGDADHTLDTARVVIRGWGTTDESFALVVEDSGGVDPLFSIRDDGNMLLKTATVDTFDGFNFNGHVGPATSGIRDAANTFDLGNCDLEFRDAYIGSNIRFDYGRSFITHDGTNSLFDFQIFDTAVVGTAGDFQTSINGSHTPPNVAGNYVISQTFGGSGGGGAVDSIDVYFNAFTPSAPMTITVDDGTNSTTLTITLPAVSVAGYISFALPPLNLLEGCDEELTWEISSPQPYTVAYYDRTPCVTGNASDRARFDFEGDAGWSNVSGIYGGGTANIGGLVQYDTLCGPANAGLGNCFSGGTLCGATGTSTPGSFIQQPGVQMVNTRPIDYTFRAYLVKTPSSAIAIESAPNNFTRMGQGSAAPDGQLDVQSDTGPVIVPRMTAAQRLALPAVPGSVVYQTDAPAAGAGAGTTQGLYGYDGSLPGWKLF